MALEKIAVKQKESVLAGLYSKLRTLQKLDLGGLYCLINGEILPFFFFLL